uniref:CSON007095 protein n=1 Tax=Culicoides sonorensis TaxID=179676 RepID=A0A336MWI1_CULSO
MAPNYPDMFKKYGNLASKEDSKDITFEFENSDVKIKAHKFLLEAVSPVFATMFSGSWKEKNNAKIRDIRPEIFQKMIDVIYLKEIVVTNFEINFTADDAIKTMKILKSSSQPTVKKRQIMRQTFGDYRTKMAEDEKTYSISTNAFKFLPSSKFKKSYFVKKAAIIDGDKNFKFNFSIDNKMDDLSLEEKPEKAETATAPAKIELQPTNGSEFKFNFNIETDEMI